VPLIAVKRRAHINIVLVLKSNQICAFALMYQYTYIKTDLKENEKNMKKM